MKEQEPTIQFATDKIFGKLCAFKFHYLNKLET